MMYVQLKFEFSMNLLYVCFGRQFPTMNDQNRLGCPYQVLLW